jgi:hypothetical protein
MPIQKLEHRLCRGRSELCFAESGTLAEVKRYCGSARVLDVPPAFRDNPDRYAMLNAPAIADSAFFYALNEKGDPPTARRVQYVQAVKKR